MQRDIIIGDVHGCLAELNELLELLQPTKEDLIIFLGDLVDKGPDSSGVVKRVRELATAVPVVLVLGNHELKHARFRSQVEEGYTPKMKHADTIRAITDQLSEEDINFLDTAVYWTSGRFGEICIHAGIPGWVDGLPSDQEIKRMSGYDRKVWNQLTMVRYIDPHGHMISLGDEKPSDPFWADTYDGRFGTVFFGHQPFIGMDPKVFSDAVGLDTGCVFGGSLTAAVLWDDWNNSRLFDDLIQVKAHAKYATAYGEE